MLDRFIGGEVQADGVEVSWLAPLEQYLTFTVGAYNKVGAENDRLDQSVGRDTSEFTYLGRIATFFNLNDSNSIDLGVSNAYTPEVEERGQEASQPVRRRPDLSLHPTQRSTYRGLIWGNEAS